MKKMMAIFAFAFSMLMLTEVNVFAGSTSPVTQETDVNEQDHNGTAATADLISVNRKVVGELWNGYDNSLAEVTDEDWYKAVITEDGYTEIAFDLEDGYLSSDIHSGWKVTVYSGDTTEVDYHFRRIEAPKTSCKMSYPKGTVVYVKVSRGNTWSNTCPKNVKYNITIKNVADATWEKEENGTPETATTISLNSTKYANIHTSNEFGNATTTGDEDYFKFVVPNDGHYTLYLENVDKTLTSVSYGWYAKAYIGVDKKTTIKDVKGQDRWLFDLSHAASNELTLKKGTVVYFRVYARNNVSGGVPSNIDYGITIKNTSGHTCKDTITKATATAHGKIEQKCSVCNQFVSSKTIYKANKITLSKVEYTYTGKTQKPTVTVKDSKGKKIANSNYTVKYTNNVKVGTGKVTITFKGKNYTGKVEKTFLINPKGTKKPVLTAANKSLKVKWTKQTKETDGYEIQYSTNKNFKSGNKTVKIKNNKTTSTILKNLKGNKKYYVRIRTYNKVGSKTYVSEWSDVVSKKTKR